MARSVTGLVTGRRGATAAVLLAIGALVGGLALRATGPTGPPVAQAATGDTATLVAGTPATLDPAAQSDIGSARVTAQLFDSVTAFDAALVLRPALAASWDILDGGRRIVFHLRPGVTFSDGTPITGADVVRSWLRIIDPAHPSQLASLMAGVVGAADHLAGRTTDPSAVGISASGQDVTVRLVRPAGDFPSIVASPTFAIVPPNFGGQVQAAGFVGSGGYLLSAVSATGITLTANPRYWAGRPAIGTLHLASDLNGKNAVQAFADGDVDYTEIGAIDAAWIRYDAALGPQLRTVPSLSLEYLGFDTSRQPFNDVRVRQAFGAAVRWGAIVDLADSGITTPATSMVPPGIQGRSDQSFLPAFDPVRARSLLAAAGYPGGANFPTVRFVTSGSSYVDGIVADLRTNLGISVQPETMNGDAFFTRLSVDPPQMWTLGWVADYPDPNDFLGVLLRSSSSNDYGRWSNPAFDAAIDDALGATDPAAARSAYDRAEAIVRSDVPVVPLSYGTGWALSRTGLLGAAENGLGLLRMAGLAWGPSR